jgi:hypothetical protein
MCLKFPVTVTVCLHQDSELNRRPLNSKLKLTRKPLDFPVAQNNARSLVPGGLAAPLLIIGNFSATGACLRRRNANAVELPNHPSLSEMSISHKSIEPAFARA